MTGHLPDVQADISTMRERLAVLTQRGLAPDERAAADAVEAALTVIEDRLEQGTNFWFWVRFAWLGNWWQGRVIESTYEQLHAARVMMIDVMDDVDLAAEVPGVVARAQQVLHADDPRRLGAAALSELDRPSKQAALRRLMADSYDAGDRQYSQLRRFRNIVLLAFAVVLALVGVGVYLVYQHPTYFPLCFDAPPGDATPVGTAAQNHVLNCPTAAGVDTPKSHDVVVVALLGLMGGLISAVASIRNLKSSSSPYDAPVALALLKLPFGALTAVGGIALIQGGFVPGLTALDTQNQILSYALLFGAAQHLITRLLDQKAKDLLEGVPTKGADPGRPASATVPGGSPATPPGEPDEPDEGETDTVAAQLLTEPEEPEPEYADSPYQGEADIEQDDESPVMAPAAAEDHE